MVHGRLLERVLEYQVGYFTRDGDHGRTSETEGGGSAVAARVVVRPFAQGRQGALGLLQLGAAFSGSRVDNRVGLRGRTVFGDGVFFDRVYVNGRRRRAGVEASWAAGPASLSGELITISDERNGMGFDGEDLSSARASGWYVAATWALTGEPKRGWLEPRRDFLRGGAGAIELVARVEALRFDALAYPGEPFGFPLASSLAGNADHVATLGLNWYLNHYARIQGNLVRESIEDPQRSPAPRAGGTFTSAVFRLQLRL
jgi:phosphate-selective porin